MKKHGTKVLTCWNLQLTRILFSYFTFRKRHGLEQRSPTFLAPGTGFMEDNFSTDRDGGVGLEGGWFRQ